jgi:hypothetical protein
MGRLGCVFLPPPAVLVIAGIVTALLVTGVI